MPFFNISLELAQEMVFFFFAADNSKWAEFGGEDDKDVGGSFRKKSMVGTGNGPLQ